MLTREEYAEIEEEFAHYRQKRGACIEALKTAQRHHGWVSNESLSDLADFLEMTTEELDGVATFYSHIFRKPVGRHVIMVCTSVSCWVMGYEQIASAHRGTAGDPVGRNDRRRPLYSSAHRLPGGLRSCPGSHDRRRPARRSGLAKNRRDPDRI